jgi:hypothetical protein
MQNIMKHPVYKDEKVQQSLYTPWGNTTGPEVWLPSFLTQAPDGGVRST